MIFAAGVLVSLGMFLWVRLVMFTLEDLHFETDIREVIATLPEDLEPLYVQFLLCVAALLMESQV